MECASRPLLTYFFSAGFVAGFSAGFAAGFSAGLVFKNRLSAVAVTTFDSTTDLSFLSVISNIPLGYYGPRVRRPSTIWNSRELLLGPPTLQLRVVRPGEANHALDYSKKYSYRL